VAKVAANQKLWNSLMRQALAKYPPKSPKASTTFAANSWASKEYERMGGKFVDSKSQVPQNMRDPKTDLEKKKKAKANKIKRARMRGDL
jgi:hypothetical protein